MQTIISTEGFEDLEDNNLILGETPSMIDSKIVFKGENNILYLEKGVKLKKCNLKFNGDNAVIYLAKSNHEYILDIAIFSNSVFYMGENSYMRKKVYGILSEQKNIIIGNDALFSMDIWFRNADPHIMYDCESKQRINPTKSIFIGDHVWLGQHSLILKDTHIGSGAIVGGMSVVAGKKIPSNTCWGGNPAKQIKENVFFTEPNVHRYLDEDTELTYSYEGDEFIYEDIPEEKLEFSEIDESLSKLKAADEKLKYIIDVVRKNKNKNRFFIAKPIIKKKWYEKYKK